MKNRFMLAPLTNLQSHQDGRLSDEELHWLTMRAKGGFGLVMTCAAHVQAIGQGFPGQLGIWSDKHFEGLSRLASAIRHQDSLAWVQLHHAGMRSPSELITHQAVCPSDHVESGARGLSKGEVQQLVEDFVRAAERANQAGFDGAEIHGAHGYILGQFLSAEINQRDDEYGGNWANRCRILHEIIDGIRSRCRDDFQLGVRLSPERFGMQLEEIRSLAAGLLLDDRIEILDLSLWDVFKTIDEGSHAGTSLLDHFCALEKGPVKLTAAGKLRSARDMEKALACGLDLVTLGRAAILHHDFPHLYRQNPNFEARPLPVSKEILAGEGLSKAFIDYLSQWDGFVSDTATR